jgi:hypothetical protein
VALAVISGPARAVPRPGPSAQTPTERAVTTRGDGTGFHVLVTGPGPGAASGPGAGSGSGQRWRTAATLSEPGTGADGWTGRACVTSSGLRAVVVYAPRRSTLRDGGFDGGFDGGSDSGSDGRPDRRAFVAVVDLVDGAVRRLPFTASLGYDDPGCGAGEQVALSSLDSRSGRTHSTVRVIDAATGRVLRSTVSAGALSSAVPYGAGVAAALGSSLVAVDPDGVEYTLATEAGTPFRLHPEGADGIDYQVPQGGRTEIRRWSQGRSTLLGTGSLGSVQLTGTGDQVFLIGADPAKVPLSAIKSGGP